MKTGRNSSYPKTVKGTQFAITVEQGGIWLYGNRQTFQTLANWMSHLAQSNPSEHYELHALWHLHDSAKITVLFDEKTQRIFKKPAILKKRLKKTGEDAGFELTFMAVEPKDLRKMQKWNKLPKNWRSG
jgi:hypothetical protein